LGARGLPFGVEKGPEILGAVVADGMGPKKLAVEGDLDRVGHNGDTDLLAPVGVADEMSLGLASSVAESVFRSLEEAAKRGITIELIEQIVRRALALADSCVILTRGRVGWSGPATEARQEVLDRYLGDGKQSTTVDDHHGIGSALPPDVTTKGRL
jgi:hypothetical protein